MKLKKEYIRVAFVKGNEGYCILITDKDGNGYRVAGPKAWGNPTNIPTTEFEIEVEELFRVINHNKYKKEMKYNEEKNNSF